MVSSSLIAYLYNFKMFLEISLSLTILSSLNARIYIFVIRNFYEHFPFKNHYNFNIFEISVSKCYNESLIKMFFVSFGTL